MDPTAPGHLPVLDDHWNGRRDGDGVDVDRPGTEARQGLLGDLTALAAVIEGQPRNSAAKRGPAGEGGGPERGHRP